MTVYTVVSGSVRKQSQSGKVARYLVERLRGPGRDIEHYDLAQARPDHWSEGDDPDPVWDRMKARFEATDGFILVSPEWNGMVPPALMNIFLLAGKTMAHKPALIVTVSGSRGGAYPVLQLRQFGYKNTGVVYLPEHVIVRNAESMLNGANATSEADAYLRKRADYALGLLAAYTDALKQVRASGVIDHANFPNGM